LDLNHVGVVRLGIAEEDPDAVVDDLPAQKRRSVVRQPPEKASR